MLYGVWYLAYGAGGSTASVDNLLSTPAYIADAAAAATGAMFGLGVEWGRPLAVALGALLMLVVRRGAADPWRLAALIALPLVFWGLTGLARADLHEPGAPRYLYPGALFLLLIAVEAARGVRLTRRRARSARGAARARHRRQPRRAAQRRGLPARPGRRARRRARRPPARGAASACRRNSGPSRRSRRRSTPRRIWPPSRTSARPRPHRRELPRLFGRGRAAADGTLVTAYGVGLAPAPGEPKGPPPAPEKAEGAATTPRGSCLRATPQAPASALELVVPPAGLLLAPAGGSAKVFLRRFSDTFPQGAVGDLVAGGRPVLLRIPGDASTAPWHARLALSGPVRVCDLG